MQDINMITPVKEKTSRKGYFIAGVIIMTIVIVIGLFSVSIIGPNLSKLLANDADTQITRALLFSTWGLFVQSPALILSVVSIIMFAFSIPSSSKAIKIFSIIFLIVSIIVCLGLGSLTFMMLFL